MAVARYRRGGGISGEEKGEKGGTRKLRPHRGTETLNIEKKKETIMFVWSNS